MASQKAASTSHQDIDIDDLLDDPELERLHAERLHAMQKEAEKRAILQRKGHGELQEVMCCCQFPLDHIDRYLCGSWPKN